MFVVWLFDKYIWTWGSNPLTVLQNQIQSRYKKDIKIQTEAKQVITFHLKVHRILLWAQDVSSSTEPRPQCDSKTSDDKNMSGSGTLSKSLHVPWRPPNCGCVKGALNLTQSESKGTSLPLAALTWMPSLLIIYRGQVQQLLDLE